MELKFEVIEQHNKNARVRTLNGLIGLSILVFTAMLVLLIQEGRPSFIAGVAMGLLGLLYTIQIIKVLLTDRATTRRLSGMTEDWFKFNPENVEVIIRRQKVYGGLTMRSGIFCIILMLVVTTILVAIRFHAFDDWFNRMASQ